MPALKLAKKSQKSIASAKTHAAIKKTASKQNLKAKTVSSKVNKSKPKTNTSKNTTGNAKTKSDAKKLFNAKSAIKKTALTPKEKVSAKKITSTKTVLSKTKQKPATTKITVSKQNTVSKQKMSINKKTSAKAEVKNLGAKKTASKNPVSQKNISKKIVPTAPRVKLPEFPTAKWGSNLVIHFEVADQLPPAHLTSIAGGIIFHGEKVVLANVPGRGWEIIGGRIDLDEDPEVTFRRETQNQLGITLSHAKMLGLMRIEHKGTMPPNCPYPYPIAYGVQYIGIMDQMLPFEGSVDSLGRSLITMDGLPEHYYGWNEYHEAVFQYAYDEYQKWRKKLKV